MFFLVFVCVLSGPQVQIDDVFTEQCNSNHRAEQSAGAAGRKRHQKGKIARSGEDAWDCLTQSSSEDPAPVSQRRFSTAGQHNRKPLPYKAVAGCCV